MSKNDNAENLRLDDVNNKRVETTRKRVAHAITLLSNPIGCLLDDRLIDNAKTDIAHAVNLLESAEQDMTFACKHFDWDQSICDQINGACKQLGITLALLEDEDNAQEAGFEGDLALALLGKAMATLVRWFDDDQDVSEV